MKAFYYSFLSVCFLLLTITELSAVVQVLPAESNTEEQSLEKEASHTFKNLSIKKQKRLKKKFRKLNSKLQKKAALDEGILDEPRFRLGVVVFAAGLVLLLLSALFIGFPGIIAWVGSLTTLIGLVLVIWSLIEYN